MAQAICFRLVNNINVMGMSNSILTRMQIIILSDFIRHTFRLNEL